MEAGSVAGRSHCGRRRRSSHGLLLRGLRGFLGQAQELLLWGQAGGQRPTAAYAAPRGNKQIRARIIGAFACLVLAKSSNIVTPLLYGGAVDYVNGDAGFSTLILWYILGAYALSRLGQQVFSEGKEYLFSRVAQRAVRGAAMTAFRHLHLLSMRFHLDRQTGGLTRAIERGAKGMEFIMTSAAFEVLPLLVEVVLDMILQLQHYS